MKRVCIYCQTWESGGIESFINNILWHMNLSDLKIDIVVEVLKESVFTKDIETLGITFHELSGSQKKRIKNYLLFTKLLNEQKYDVIHLNIFQALPLIYLLEAKRKSIPVRIAHSHNTMLRHNRTRMLKMGIHRFASYLFAKNATDLWACSADAAKFMFPTMLLRKKTYQFIPNGIDLQRFQFNEAERRNIRKQLQLENTFVVGNVGRLCRQKNQSFLIDVFAQIHAENASARLLLIGEGEALTELKQKVARLSITDAVIFYGTTFHVEKLLWAMDVFVFPSIFEGLGIATIEAQAAGLPTICSDRIPKEALASSLALQIPLDAPADLWRTAIVHAQNRRVNINVVKQLEAKGFNINTVSANIFYAYCR